MEGGSLAEEKKAVCRSLTNVVKASPLKEAIDPKAFFMMLNTNFSLLYSARVLTLSPIWDALSQLHPPEQLFGLFLKFAQAGRQLGVDVVLPPAVDALTTEQREAHLELFHTSDFQQPTELTPLLGLEAISDHGTPMPVELSTADLKPLVPDDLRRRVNLAVLESAKASPVATKIDANQVAFTVDENFATIFDGESFNAHPIIEGMRSVEGVSEEDIFPFVERLRAALDELRVRLDVPSIAVRPERAQILLQEMARADRAEASARANVALKPTAPEPPPGEPAPPRATNRESRLRKWGLRSVREQSGARAYVQPGLYLLVLLVVVGWGWLTRPNRGLDPSDYPMLPLTACELVKDSFQGTVDMAAWSKLRYAERDRAVKDLQAALQKDGVLANAQLRDEKRALLASASGPRLIASKGFLRSNLPPNDSTVPEDRAADLPKK